MNEELEREVDSPDSIPQKKELTVPELHFFGKTMAVAEENAEFFLAKNYTEVNRGTHIPTDGEPMHFITLAYGSR